MFCLLYAVGSDMYANDSFTLEGTPRPSGAFFPAVTLYNYEDYMLTVRVTGRCTH